LIIWVQKGKKAKRSKYKSKSSMVIHTCNPSYLGRTGRRITISRPAQEKLVRLYLQKKKKCKNKRTGGLAQVLELLSNMGKGLGSIPGLLKKHGTLLI
jgi:hypothetical protein